MISELLQQIMLTCGLKQKDLAEVLEVPLQRVKNLTAGYVQKLAPEETRRLVQALNLSAHWLATGEGEMFNPDGGAQFGEMLMQLKLCARRVNELGLTGSEAIAARDIAHGVAVGKLGIVKSGFLTLNPLSPDETVLIGLYRKANEDVRRAAIAALASAQSKSKRKAEK